MILRSAILLASVVLIFAQNAPQRAKSVDYPIHGAAPGMEIGLEYLVHSIPGDARYYVARDYLVVDVGVFPSTKNGVAIYPSQFTLLVNNKTVLYSVSAGSVAASIKHPDWSQQRGVTAAAGNDNAAIVLGAPQQTPRFPGDTRGNVPLNIPQPPQSDDGKNLGQQRERPVEETVTNAALPEGQTSKPVKGCLYFYFEGKIKSIKSLALVYDGGDSQPKSKIPIL